MTSLLLVFFVGSLWAVTPATTLTVTYAMQQTIVNLHNTARSKEPATNMQSMTWDSALAQKAQEWTDRCVFEHRPYSRNKYWGENLAATYYTGGNNEISLIGDMFQMWMDEKAYTSGGNYEHCCSPQGTGCCHYTQVIWADSNKVGCGFTACPNLTYKSKSLGPELFMACYYAPGGNHPTYVGGKRVWRPFQ